MQLALPWLAAAVLPLHLAGLARTQDAQVERFPARVIEHDRSLVALAGDEDGELLAYADDNGGVFLWDLERDAQRWGFPGPRPRAVDLDIGEDLVVFTVGVTMFSGHELGDGKEVRGIGGPNFADSSTSIAVDSRGRWVWLGLNTGLTRLSVNDVSGWSRRALDNGGSTVIAMDAKDKLVAVGGADGTLRFAGAKSASVDDKKVFEAHQGPVTALCFDGKGSAVLSGGQDHGVRLTSVSSGKARLVIAGHEAAITAVTCDPRGKWLAVADASGVVRLWSAAKGELLAELAGADAEPCVDLVAGARGASLAAARGRDITIWDLGEL